MTTTVVTFRDETEELPTEWEAYVWMVNNFLRDKGDFFAAKRVDLKHVCEGGRHALMFAPSSTDMNQPRRLSNGWYAETCLSEQQKIGNLYLLAQAIGLSSERDYKWQAENRPTIMHRDVSTMLDELGVLPSKSQ